MVEKKIYALQDLNSLRSAPDLNKTQSKYLLEELYQYIHQSSWITIGIMAPSSELALLSLKEIERSFSLPPMNIITKPDKEGPVFLKANQRTGDAYVRIEYGLGEGILISTQQEEIDKKVNTFGPFPLDFF